MTKNDYIEKITQNLEHLTKDELKDVSILTSAQYGVRLKVAEKEYIEKEIADLKYQLQQQALPVVPECVAKWYEEHKDDLESSIYRLCIEFNQKVVNTFKTKTKLENWFDYTENKPIETLIRMQEGYEVEKPQLFYIDLPKVFGLSDSTSDSTFVSKAESGIILEFTKGKDYALKLTEQEIKSIDERYWQFAVPVEEGK
ncbi:hypothetical protein [Lactococcus phage D7138]